MPLKIIREDITKMRVDAIVNSTNEEMVGYSGVDLAVHTCAGEELDRECRRIAPLGLGEVKLTDGYNLPAKYIIHTSGPIWQGGLCGERVLLKSCYEEALNLAFAYKCKTIAFPLISSGTYGYPKDSVLKYAVQIISDFLKTHEMTVYICVFDKTSYEFSRELFSDLSVAIEGGKTEPSPTIDSYIKSKEKTFAYKLFELIDQSGMSDVECYKKANVDRKTFSKIKSRPDTYKPSKQTAVAFAIALELNLDKTQELLAAAGMTLSASFTFDIIIRYFIEKGNYNIFEINEALFEFDQTLLGV